VKFGILTSGSHISRRQFLAVTFLLSGTLAWFFFSFSWLDAFVTRISSDWVYVVPGGGTLLKFLSTYGASALYFASAGVSALVGAAISHKVNRRSLLFSWIMLGVISSLLLIFMQGIFFAILAIILLGISLGFGYPACLAFLAESTVPEERARVAGATFFIAFVLVIIFNSILSVSGFGVVGAAIFAAILRLASFFGLKLDLTKAQEIVVEVKVSVLNRKNFLFYTIPWIIFNIANGLIAFVTLGLYNDPVYVDAVNMGTPIHFLAAGLFALVGGFVADRLGRRQPVVFGLILLGASFALLGVFTSPLTMLFYLVVSGAAWGFLMTVYTAIPGDLSVAGGREKYYAIATVIPLLLYMSLTSTANLFGIVVFAGALANILSILLFVSIIPVIRASECLSESKMRERELKEHMEKIEELLKESNTK
jgi:MFS family permease